MKGAHFGQDPNKSQTEGTELIAGSVRVFREKLFLLVRELL